MNRTICTVYFCVHTCSTAQQGRNNNNQQNRENSLALCFAHTALFACCSLWMGGVDLEGTAEGTKAKMVTWVKWTISLLERLRNINGPATAQAYRNSSPPLAPPECTYTTMGQVCANSNETHKHRAWTWTLLAEPTVGCVTAQREQAQARSTENAEPNEGCTNEPGNVRDAWGTVVTLLSGLHARKPQ